MLNIILSILALTFAYIIYKIILKPYLTVLRVKKQGFRSDFYPILGFVKTISKGLKEHGDQLIYLKDSKANAGFRGIASNFFNVPMLMLIEPTLIKEFHGKQDLYTKPDKFFSLFKDLVGDGLLFVDGAKWKTHRKLVSMAFHYEILKEMIADFGKITQEFYEKIKSGDMKNVSIMNEYQAITGEAVGRLFFGDNFSNYTIKGERLTTFLANLITKTGEISMSSLNMMFGKKLIKAGYFKDHRDLAENAKLFKDKCSQIIKTKMKECEEEHKNGIQSKRNLVNLFYEQRVSNPQDALSDDDILGEFITFFLAGMDTTGHLVTMATYYLHQNPHHRQKLMEEIEKYCNDFNNVNLDELNKMEYMTAFMKECLRMATPAPFVFDREALVDHKLGDIEVKAGTFVNTSFLSNNYNPNYHNEPEKFIPERWLDAESQTMRTLASNPFVFTPFSIGGRNCIGQHMAMNEARVLFSLFLKNFDFEFSEKDYKKRMTIKFLYEFEKDLKLNLENKLTA